jgi:hypothetical protein
MREPSVDRDALIDVLIHRTATRCVARLLLGLFVTAQFASAAYACSEMTVGSMGVQGYGAVAGANALAGMPVDVWPTESGSTDLAEGDLCLTHCQFGRQAADSAPVPTPMVALLAGDTTLPSMARLAGYATALTMANRPPPPADPPHAILHCCLRI